MTPPRAPVARLGIERAFAASLASAGIASVADVLARAPCVRDLPDRSNHVLRLDGLVVHVKRTKGAAASAEAASIARARAAGAPTATIVFEGADAAYGAIVGTLDLAPARPLDELLAADAIPASRRGAVIDALASAVAALHRAELFPKDLYLNHVFVDPDDPSGRVTLIDLERAAARRWFVRRAVVRDLAALRASTPDDRVPTEERRRFLEAYLRARGLVPSADGPALAAAVRRKAASIRRHAPRTPVGDAAGPRGRGP